ncbi:hypothetical protein [Bradyrhizobium sp. SK17]|uniref:hypothetical protein n=1 Tax=Bradyrhizobium sp. SK17 TaxID=2057741 RepID=UPI00143D7215|nr:hypothetical protein [Bradyrhizobium sp. SK17]
MTALDTSPRPGDDENAPGPGDAGTGRGRLAASCDRGALALRQSRCGLRGARFGLASGGVTVTAGSRSGPACVVAVCPWTGQTKAIMDAEMRNRRDET